MATSPDIPTDAGADRRGATFGLVHGAWHGAWCWERLIPELERLGHRAVAMDLPCDDPDADFRDDVMVIERALAERALAERALPERALADAPPAIILVGHSLAGVLLPLAAARVPARRLVYLCAILHPALLPPGAPHPHPRGVFASLERSPDGSHRWVSPEACREALYGDCSEAAAAAAFARLRRQHTARRWADVPVPDPWPAVPVSSIVCAEDRAVSPEWGTWAARRRLHVEPIVLPGGHSPFLSRPEALARALDALARDDLDSADERIVETVDHP